MQYYLHVYVIEIQRYCMTENFTLENIRDVQVYHISEMIRDLNFRRSLRTQKVHKLSE